MSVYVFFPQVLKMPYLRRVCYQDWLLAELFDDPAARATALSIDRSGYPPFEGHLQAHQQQHIVLTQKKPQNQ